MLTLAVLSPGLIFFLIVGFVGFVVLAAKRHEEKLEAAWVAAAKAHGLTYSSKKTMGSTERKLVGEHHGYPVKVSTFTEGSGKSRKTYTRYRVRYTHLGLGLELSQQHFFSGLRSTLTGRQDIVIGSKEFDDEVIVQGGSSREVIEYLTRDRQLAIQRFLTGKRRALITDSEASFIVHKAADSPEKIGGSLEGLLALVEVLELRPSERAGGHPAGRSEPPPLHDDVLAGLNPEPVSAPLEPPPLASPPAIPPVPPVAPIDLPLGELAGGAASHDRLTDAELAAQLDPVTPPPEREPRSALESSPKLESRSALESSPRLESRSALESSPKLESTPKLESPAAFQATAPGAPEPTPPHADEPAAAPRQAAPGSAGLDYHTVRAELFESRRMSYETKELFQSRYQGQPVRWRGELTRLTSYSSDLVFSGAGVKAIVALEPYQDGPFEKDVEAVVALPAGVEADLQAYVGQPVTLSGQLLSCDDFMRKLFVVDGLLEQSS